MNCGLNIDQVDEIERPDANGFPLRKSEWRPSKTRKPSPEKAISVLNFPFHDPLMGGGSVAMGII
jgi:hypothetical protein